MTRHSEFEGLIVDLLNYSGWLAWRTHTGRDRPTVSGMPDILAVRPGRVMAVEVKIKPDKPSADQERMLGELRAHGVTVCVAYCLEDVKEAMRG
jgi:hypothetical protein